MPGLASGPQPSRGAWVVLVEMPTLCAKGKAARPPAQPCRGGHEPAGTEKGKGRQGTWPHPLRSRWHGIHVHDGNTGGGEPGPPEKEHTGPCTRRLGGSTGSTVHTARLAFLSQVVFCLWGCRGQQRVPGSRGRVPSGPPAPSTAGLEGKCPILRKCHSSCFYPTLSLIARKQECPQRVMEFSENPTSFSRTNNRH